LFSLDHGWGSPPVASGSADSSDPPPPSSIASSPQKKRSRFFSGFIDPNEETTDGDVEQGSRTSRATGNTPGGKHKSFTRKVSALYMKQLEGAKASKFAVKNFDLF
jgi:hypothetical protein